MFFFSFPFADSDFKEKLIRNVKKEVSVFIRMRALCEFISLLHDLEKQRFSAVVLNRG
jgi:hypothetical protein